MVLLELFVVKSRLPSAAILTRIVIITFGLALFFGQPAALAVLGLDGSHGRVTMMPGYLVSLLAPAFFLRALWVASDVFVRIDRGDAFGPAMVRGLKDIGRNLMFGAFAAIVVDPSLKYLIDNGFRDMRGASFDLDVENVTLALVGFVLVLLARQGQNLKSKLDEFV
jgi:hypothetical protein